MNLSKLKEPFKNNSRLKIIAEILIVLALVFIIFMVFRNIGKCASNTPADDRPEPVNVPIIEMPETGYYEHEVMTPSVKASIENLVADLPLPDTLASKENCIMFDSVEGWSEITEMDEPDKEAIQRFNCIQIANYLTVNPEGAHLLRVAVIMGTILLIAVLKLIVSIINSIILRPRNPKRPKEPAHIYHRPKKKFYKQKKEQ